MNANGFALAATVILLLPMVYFFFTSITFLLATLSDPVVTRLLRGLFNTYFSMVVGFCAVGSLAYLSSGRPGVATGLGLIAAVAFGARRWFLARLDAQIRARDEGDGSAVPRLRRLHLAGMLYNAVQCVLIIASIPNVLSPA
jgi:hypothetical protein